MDVIFSFSGWTPWRAGAGLCGQCSRCPTPASALGGVRAVGVADFGLSGRCVMVSHCLHLFFLSSICWTSFYA